MNNQPAKAIAFNILSYEQPVIIYPYFLVSFCLWSEIPALFTFPFSHTQKRPAPSSGSQTLKITAKIPTPGQTG